MREREVGSIHVVQEFEFGALTFESFISLRSMGFTYHDARQILEALVLFSIVLIVACDVVCM
jgi:hypothetical protein